MKELSEKQKENDTLLASKTEELNKAKLNYLVATKLDNQYSKVYSIIADGIKELRDGTVNGLISSKTAETALDRYHTIISKVVESKDINVITAAINTMNKINNIIIAKKVEKTATNKQPVLSNKNTVSNNTKTLNSNHVINKNHKPIIKQTNVLNKEAYTGNGSILADRRYNSLCDEMLAEIVKIAIKD